jgi:hypothetical protein
MGESIGIDSLFGRLGSIDPPRSGTGSGNIPAGRRKRTGGHAPRRTAWKKKPSGRTAVPAPQPPKTGFGPIQGDCHSAWEARTVDSPECANSVRGVSGGSRVPALVPAFQGRSKCCGTHSAREARTVDFGALPLSRDLGSASAASAASAASRRYQP